MLQLNCYSTKRLKEDNICLSIRNLCLQKDVILPLQYSSNFSKVHDVYFSYRVDQTLEVFIDDFLVFEESYDDYLQNLENVLKKCEEINL